MESARVGWSTSRLARKFTIRFRCESGTALGAASEPEVKSTTAGWSGSGWGRCFRHLPGNRYVQSSVDIASSFPIPARTSSRKT